MNSKIVIHGSSYFVQYQSFVEAVYFFLRSYKSCLVFSFQMLCILLELLIFCYIDDKFKFVQNLSQIVEIEPLI